jgi:hypothetical protein
MSKYTLAQVMNCIFHNFFIPLLTSESLLVTWCTNIQQLYVLPTLYLCFVFIWEQTATCATYSINRLLFITEMKSDYSAVRTGDLNKAVCVWGFLWFSSALRPGYTMQSRDTASTPLLRLSAWKKSRTPSLRLSQSGLRTQTSNQAKFIPPIISPVPPRR